MKKLLEKIKNCSEESYFIFDLYKKIETAIIKGKIKDEDRRALCTAYYNQGCILHLNEKNQFNDINHYKFSQNIRDLQTAYDSIKRA